MEGQKTAIRDALRSLQQSLGRFEQTTHGRLGPATINDVASELAACYENPNAYQTSQLSQVIEAFLGSETC